MTLGYQRQSAEQSDAGISVIELLVGLAIVAIAAIALAALVRFPEVAKPDSEAAFRSFLAAAMEAVMRNGEIGLMLLSPGEARIGTEVLAWDSEDLEVAALGATTPRPIRLLLYPDGSLSGPKLELLSAGRRQPLPGIFRLTQ